MEASLSLIATFHVVVQAGTVRGAAKRLHRTQPAITARIQQLEEQLGVALFTRVGRRLELTPTGRLAAAHARAVVDAGKSFEDQVLATSPRPKGVLRVGALPTISSYRLAPVLAGLVEAYPEVHVDMVLRPVEPMLAELRAGRLDTMVWVGEPAGSDLLHETIDTIHPVAVFRRDDAPSQATVGPTTLRERSYVSFGTELVGDPFFDAVSAYAKEHGLEEKSRLRAAHIQSIKSLVAAGAGFGILPDYTVVEPELVGLPMQGLRTKVPVVLTSRHSRDSGDNVSRLVSLLRGLLNGAKNASLPRIA